MSNFKVNSSDLCGNKALDKLHCHLLFIHAFSKLRCIFKVLMMVDKTKVSTPKCTAENSPTRCDTQNSFWILPVR